MNRNVRKFLSMLTTVLALLGSSRVLAEIDVCGRVLARRRPQLAHPSC